MKVVAISDLHGNLPLIEEVACIYCISGDIMPLNIQSNDRKCRKWLREDFIPWANNLPCAHVILVAGNHDFVFYRMEKPDIDKIFEGSKVIYLENSGVQLEGLNIFGTPWCHQFGRWAFMADDDKLADLFSEIPDNVDILVTHDAPYGTSDICFQKVYWNYGEHIGCVPLRDAILAKKPKLVLHGHLHSTNHENEVLGESDVYNVSLLDENYDLIYKPLILDVNEHS